MSDILLSSLATYMVDRPKVITFPTRGYLCGFNAGWGVEILAEWAIYLMGLDLNLMDRVAKGS